MLRLRFACALLVLIPCFVFAQERIIELTIEDKNAGIVVLHETRRGLLIQRSDIPADTLSASALDTLEKISEDGCKDCFSVEELGAYREDTRAGKGYLSLRPSLIPTTAFRMHRSREASAEFLQRRFALINNFTFSIREAEGEKTAGIGIVESRVSLGQLGIIETGYRHIDSGEANNSQRLPTRLVNHFIDAQVSYELGETRTDADPNDSSIGITGFRIYRNFATRPDITSRPVYDFFALVERPSIIELYRNSQLERREQVDRPGPIQLSDYRPSGTGKVLLIIRDALGTRRLVETDLIVDQRNLGRGIWDFSLAGGYLRDTEGDIDKESQASSVRLAYGFTENLTIGLLAEGAAYGEESPLYTGNDYLWNSGFTLLWNTPIGQFDAIAKRSMDDHKNEADAYRLSWRKSGLLGGRFHYSLGATGFKEEDNFSTIGGRRRQLEGWRSFGGISYRNVFLSANIAETDGIKSHGAAIGWRLGKVAIDASVQAQDDVAPLYTLAFGYAFGGPVSYAQVGTQKREQSNQLESFTSARGRNDSNTVNWRVEAFHENLTHSNRGSANISWATDHINAAYEARYVNERHEQFADVGFALGFVDAPTLYLGRQLISNEALAVVDTQLPGVKFSVQGRTAESNKYGKGVLPVIGFGRRFASIDASTLPDNNLVKNTLEEVSTVPGQASRATFILNSPAAFITIEGVAPGEIISVNDQELRVYEFGAFAENLVLGPNVVRHADREYTLVIKNFDESLPTYALGRRDME